MMEIKVDADLVNKVVAEAIIKSALGQELEKVINKQMKEAIDGYSSPVKTLISAHLTSIIKEVLEKDYREKIVAKVSSLLTSEHIDTIVNASVEKAITMLKDAGYR